MYSLIILTLVSLVRSHDLIVGTNTEGRKIFDEVRHANPAIWRQIDNVTVTTTDAEVISRIVVTDQRPDKDGDIKVVEGGEGQKNVTFELKSPTALRGYDFQIQVYSIPEDKYNSKKDATTSQPRVQRNPEEDRNRPRIIPGIVNQLESNNTSDATSTFAGDTKVNEDKAKTANKDSEVNEHKLGGPVPFIGNIPQAAPTVNTPRTGEAATVTQARHARHAFNPEIPEENHSSPKKTNENKDEARNENSSTHLPTLVSRQGSLNRHAPVSITNKQDNSSDAKRDARDTKDKKNDNNDSPLEITFKQHPALDSKQGNTPASPSVYEINKPQNVNGGKRVVRDTEHENKNNINVTPKSSSTQHPVLVSKQGAFNNPTPTFTADTAKATSGKRDSRDVENNKKSDESTDPKENSSLHPALASRKSAFNNPISVASISTPENDKSAKRDARDTEADKKSTNNDTPKENSSTQHPVRVSKQNVHSKFSSRPNNTNEGKRQERDVSITDNNKKHDDISAPKEDFHNAHPALVSRQGAVNIPAPKSTTSKTENLNEGKRQERDTENKKTNDDTAKSHENSFTPRPALVSRQGTFNTPPSLYKTDKPDSRDNEKRVARDTEHDKKSNSNVTPHDSTLTQYSELVPRLDSLNRPTPVPEKNNPENVNEGKRGARDTTVEKKNGNPASSNDKSSTQHPALVGRESAFNGPNSEPTITKAENINDGKRNARDADNNKKSNNNATPKETSSTHRPGLFSRHGAPKTPLSVPKTNKPENKNDDGKRVTRDTDHENKNDNATPKENTSAQPALSRHGAINRPTPLPAISKAEHLNDGKRDARDTENNKNLTPKEISPTHPSLPSKPGVFNSPTPTSTTNDGKRNERDTEHDKKSNNNPTPKTDEDSPQDRFNFDFTKLNAPSSSQDQTAEKKNEENKHQTHFVPPPGYIRTVPASTTTEKDRVARDVQSDDKKEHHPRAFTNDQKQDGKTNDASTASVDQTPTAKSIIGEDGLKRLPSGVVIPRGLNQPLPYSTASPTTKAQSKRDTEPKDSAAEQKNKEDAFKISPRIIGAQNSTNSEQKPVISIQ